MYVCGRKLAAVLWWTALGWESGRVEEGRRGTVGEERRIEWVE